ncbi:hypothetical protein ACFWZU_05400 [Frateuria sp. GZRR33]|uniref:EF-hand domain-containing protein n=1 Tax=Frateuria sp. GZRR33 TaxID=3351535 RepID=UPI003EDBF6B3
MRHLLPLLTVLCATAHASDYPTAVSAYLARFDRDGDGRIAPQEYVDYLSAGFHAMDANGDGVLQPDELPPGPRRLPRTLAAFQADLRAQFRRSDRNHDGFLSALELAQPPG